MPKKLTVDWERIEKEYRIGQASIRSIATKHGLSAMAICKKAKKYGWSRDRSEEVKARTMAALISPPPLKIETDPDPCYPEERDIEIAVQTNLEVIRSHRKDLQRMREVEQKLLEELADNPTKLYITQYQGGIVEKEVGIAVTDRAAAISALASTQQRRIMLERTAFGMDNSSPSVGDDGEPLQRITIEFIRPGQLIATSSRVIE